MELQAKHNLDYPFKVRSVHGRWVWSEAQQKVVWSEEIEGEAEPASASPMAGSCQPGNNDLATSEAQMANNRQRETKKVERGRSDASIKLEDTNKLVRDGKTREGYWIREDARQLDSFKLRDQAKKYFDQERATQIALGKVRGYDAEINDAQAEIIIKRHEAR